MPIRYLIFIVILFQGCAGISKIDNHHLVRNAEPAGYSFLNGHQNDNKRDDVTLILAFSGGGTRAAALSYGVLKALNEIEISGTNTSFSLLDEVDVISSVSGGSFTAAYYGLHGKEIFNEFDKRFLKKDVSGDLIHRILSIGFWFSNTTRSERAVAYHEANLFKGATFKDLMEAGGPLIIINATDLGGGVRFSFLQEYFNLLCSDLASFSVARAVTASSAVPVIFSPIVLQNHSGCNSSEQRYLQTKNTIDLSMQVGQVVSGLKTYADKESRRFIHLVDGGISDNLGLMAYFEMVEVAGGAGMVARQLGTSPNKHFVIISVDASTHTRNNIEKSNEDPSIEDTVNTMTDIQLHRYNAATQDLMNTTLQRWANELSTPETKVVPYFVRLGFEDLKKSSQNYVNAIPTSFSISDDQVDHLVDLGGKLLNNNPEFIRFLQDVGKQGP